MSEKKKFNLIAAACSNRGIGINGDLPWNLSRELLHFNNTTKRIRDTNKSNVVIMGRRTYFAWPENERPLDNRINVVLASDFKESTLPDSVLVFSSLDTAVEHFETEDMKEKIENVWILGGSSVYKEAMESDRFHRIYLTEIHEEFECDTFFPEMDETKLKQVQNDPEIPEEEQEENGVKYHFKIYEKI